MEEQVTHGEWCMRPSFERRASVRWNWELEKYSWYPEEIEKRRLKWQGRAEVGRPDFACLSSRPGRPEPWAENEPVAMVLGPAGMGVRFLLVCGRLFSCGESLGNSPRSLLAPWSPGWAFGRTPIAIVLGARSPCGARQPAGLFKTMRKYGEASGIQNSPSSEASFQGTWVKPRRQAGTGG